MAQSSENVSYVAGTVPIAIIMTVICLFLVNDVRSPTTYTVGDDDGWDPVVLMDTWTVGHEAKPFSLAIFSVHN